MTKARDIASAAPAPAGVTSTELGYVDGVTSALQTQLNQKPEYAAGKNKIINGDFGIWQRGTTFSSSPTFTADRWELFLNGTGATRTVSQQSFTFGTAPVAGYEGKFFLRYDQSVAGSGATFNIVRQRIEDVRTFAGQTVTVSFWAKAAATTTMDAIRFTQNFGTGGSGGVGITAATAPVFTTSWTRYSYTVAIPSIAGKTIGTYDGLELRFLYPINSTFTVDIWGVQVEAGSTATPFATATGNPALELTASSSPTDGQTLTVDSTVVGGVKWATPGGGATSYTLLNAGGTALTGTTVTISGISGKNSLMIIVVDASSTNASIQPIIRFNSDSGSNYSSYGFQTYGRTTYSKDQFSKNSGTGTSFGLGVSGNNAAAAVSGYMFVDGANSTGPKILQSISSGDQAGGSADNYAILAGGLYTGSSAISSVSLVCNSGNWDGGTIFVYGA